MQAEVNDFLGKCLKNPSRKRIDPLADELADKHSEWLDEFYVQAVEVN